MMPLMLVLMLLLLLGVDAAVHVCLFATAVLSTMETQIAFLHQVIQFCRSSKTCLEGNKSFDEAVRFLAWRLVRINMKCLTICSVTKNRKAWIGRAELLILWNIRIVPRICLKLQTTNLHQSTHDKRAHQLYVRVWLPFHSYQCDMAYM